MPKDIQKRMEKLSISTERTKNLRRTKPPRRKEHWLYGFHLKKRYARRLSEKFGLPYQTDPWSALVTVQRHLIYRCRVHCSFRSIKHRGKNTKFLVFLEDEGRKRLHLNTLTEEEVERVRVELLLPEGPTPKWYDVDDEYDDYADLTSENEPMPPNKRSGTLHAQEERKIDELKYSKANTSDKTFNGSGSAIATDDIGMRDKDYGSHMDDHYFDMLFGSDEKYKAAVLVNSASLSARLFQRGLRCTQCKE